MKIESLNLVVDLNRDGAYSPWELWEAAKDIYRLPGNLVVEALGNIPYVSPVLKISASEATGYASLNGLLALTLSLLFWILVIFAVLMWTSPSDDDIEDTSVIPMNANAGEALPTYDDTASLPQRPAVSTVQARVHLPVSRHIYAAPGKTPRKHRRRHHLINYLIRHAK